MKKILVLLLFLTIGIGYFLRPTKFRFFLANYVYPDNYRCEDVDCGWMYLSTPFQKDSAKLYSCNTQSDQLISSKEQCDKCPNREMVKNACVLKCAKGLRRVATHCEEPCPTNTFQESEWIRGECYSCDTFQAVIVDTPEECQKCPAREYKEVWLEHLGDLFNVQRCILKNCAEQEIHTIGGECVPCNSHHKSISYTTKEECLKCPNRKYVPVQRSVESFHFDDRLAAYGECTEL